MSPYGGGIASALSVKECRPKSGADLTILFAVKMTIDIKEPIGHSIYLVVSNFSVKNGFFFCKRNGRTNVLRRYRATFLPKYIHNTRGSS